MPLTTEQKLDIANSGGSFQEDGPNSWVGKKIRKGTKLGVITHDMNGAYRELTVRFEDRTEETIRMNNLGKDQEYIHEYEWQTTYEGKPVWYRF
jgi:hypothetical protein